VVDVAGAETEEGGLDAALAAARTGDEAGFRVLWRALQPRLLRYLYLHAGEAADDIAAETWLHIVRDLGRFRGDADEFRAWLFTVARHRAIDAARARRARPAIPLGDVTALAHGEAAVSAEAAVLEWTATRDALALVATLPAEQAEMVALRVVAGLDVATVARLVGKSPGAVRVGVHRGLRALAQKSPSRAGVER